MPRRGPSDLEALERLEPCEEGRAVMRRQLRAQPLYAARVALPDLVALLVGLPGRGGHIKQYIVRNSKDTLHKIIIKQHESYIIRNHLRNCIYELRSELENPLHCANNSPPRSGRRKND